jgi:hypothetical protein
VVIGWLSSSTPAAQSGILCPVRAKRRNSIGKYMSERSLGIVNVIRWCDLDVEH